MESDLAFMTLTEPLDSTKFPPMRIEGITSTTPETTKFLTGYLHRSRSANDNHPMTEQCNITLNFPAVHQFLHNCSTTHRMSGSPIYFIPDKNPVMIGMNAGMRNDGRVDDDDDTEYSLKRANIAIDGYAIRDGLMRYLASGLLDPYAENSGCK